MERFGKPRPPKCGVVRRLRLREWADGGWPNNAKSYRNMGVTYSSAGEYGNAIDVLESSEPLLGRTARAAGCLEVAAVELDLPAPTTGCAEMPMDGRIVVCAQCQRRNRIPASPLVPPAPGLELAAAEVDRRETPPRPQRYRAFLSYSHSDRKVTAMAPSQLKTMTVPRALVGSRKIRGPAPAKLGASSR